MALGETLKNARVQKGLSASEVAESTHMMVQIVEDLEREDFRRIAAPIYGRGFVRLYAEMMQLDPEPLVRDFMDLYAGARAPAVRTKHVEAAPPAEGPVSRGLSGQGPSALQPQRQTVQPRPLVRPLSVPQPLTAAPVRVEEAPAPVVVRVEKPVEEEPESLASGRAPEAAEPRDEARAASLVIEPEESDVESDEPDLFRPHSLRRKPAESDRASEEKGAEESRRPARSRKIPVFKIGGRLEEAEREPEVRDEAAHERRVARIQKFVDGFNDLRSGVERKLPTALPHKQIVAFGSLGLALVVCMAVGIRMLFKLTGSAVKESPDVLIEAVAPPPDMYVD
jgi:hypothetical protein